MSRFRFYNVGEGGFYTGRLDSGKRIVYDCGSQSKNSDKYIEAAINYEADDYKEIDCLFVSHFHKDHISGLEMLSNRFAIKKVVLPYLGNDYLVSICSIAYMGNYFSKIDYEIGNIFLLNRDFLDNSKWEIEDDFFSENYCYRTKTISIDNWEFYIINRTVNDKIMNNISSELNLLFNGEKIHDIFKKKKNINRIVSIYKHNLKDLNLSDLIVLHKKKDSNEFTLLTGDVEFDFSMIELCKRIIKNGTIKHFQVPHHGSKEDWKKTQGIRELAENFYIQFGLGFRNGIPSTDVIEDISKMKKELYLAYQSNKPLFEENEYEVK